MMLHQYWKFTACAYLALAVVPSGGYGFGVTGEQGPMVVKRSGNVTLNCYIKGHDYDGLQHTIRWVKLVDGNSVPISANTIVDATLPEDKYKVTPMRDLPTYYLDLQLRISNAGLNDNGSYVCEVLGVGGHEVLGRHTVDLLVREQVRKLQLIYNNNGTNITSILDSSINLEYATPSDVTCQSSGGNPPPRLRVFLSHTDITDRFVQRRMSVTYTGSPPWDQHFVYSNQITCPQCKFRRGDNGKLLQCESTVDGFDNIVTTSRPLTIYFKPVIDCADKVMAVKGSRNFHISCKIKSHPLPDEVKWLVGTSMTFHEGYESKRYSVVGEKVHGTLRTSTLILTEVSEEHFLMKYVLMARNKHGVMQKTMMLVRGSKPMHQADSYRDGNGKGPPYSTDKPRIVAIGHAGYSGSSPGVATSLLVTLAAAVCASVALR